MHRTTGLALLLGMLGVAVAAPVPDHLMLKGDPICYPVRVGDKCVHQLSNGELSFTVTKVEKLADGFRVTSDVADGTTNSNYAQTVIVSPKGVDLVEHAGRKVDPPISWLKMPHAERNSWSATWAPTGVKFDFTAKGWEMVEVPAGRFRAMKVERVESQEGTVQGTTSYWYSPGLGCIKISGRNPARVLKSFTPGKE